MAKFYAKNSVSGLPTGPIQAEQVYDLELEDIKALVAKRYGGDEPREEYAVLVPQAAWEEMQLQAKRGQLCARCGTLIL